MSRGPCSDCWTSLIHAYSLILRGMQAKPGLLNTNIIGQNVLETTSILHTSRNQLNTYWAIALPNFTWLYTFSVYIFVSDTNINLKPILALLFQQFNDWCFQFLSAAWFLELHQQIFLVLLMGVASIKIYMDINHIPIT